MGIWHKFTLIVTVAGVFVGLGAMVFILKLLARVNGFF